MEQYYEKNENVLLQKAAEFGMRGWNPEAMKAKVPLLRKIHTSRYIELPSLLQSTSSLLAPVNLEET
jgi:hypothetical protein